MREALCHVLYTIFLNAQNNPMKWVLSPFCKKLRLREVKYLPQSYATSGARIHPRQPDL